jgi:hypothetical protein
MKKIIWIISAIILAIPIFAQDNCWTIYNDVIPVFSPSGNPIAISTLGWNYDSTHSIEFESSLPYNGWEIYEGYRHKNAFNGFSTDNKYWDLDTVSGIFQLHLFDDSATVDFPPPDTTVYVTGYTTAILRNDAIGDFGYGYIETKVKLPVDTTLCSSLWGFQGSYPLSNYREVDIFETINDKILFNLYHGHSTDSTYYGGRIRMDLSLFNDSDWYIFGFEWFPRSYRFYINHNLVGEFNPDADCTEDYLSPIQFWMLWLTNWNGNDDPTGTFPKTLTADYIRFYSLDLTNISNDFYDYLSNYDYGVWKTVHLGDTYSSDATFNDNGRHALRSMDGFTLGAGFEVAAGTEFETIIYKP